MTTISQMSQSVLWQQFCLAKMNEALDSRGKSSWLKFQGMSLSVAQDWLDRHGQAGAAQSLANQFEDWQAKAYAPAIEKPRTTPLDEPEEHNPTGPADREPDITDKINPKGKHFRTPLLQKIFRARRYPFVWGDPGAGKTHLMESLAKDMGIPFVLITSSPDMFKSELRGSQSPLTGAYFPTEFRNAWENGGLVLQDEGALTPGGLLNLLNSALAQKIMPFPDGQTIPMHEDFFYAVADNSAGYGNDPLFPERGDMGGAFRDRLTYVKFGYDEKIELRVLEQIFGDFRRAERWHAVVKTLRVELTKANVPLFASPRMAYASALWWKEDLPWEEIMEMELYKGANQDVKNLAAPILEKLKGKF